MATMMKLVKDTRIARAKKIPKAAKGWKVVTPGKLGLKASCEAQFEHSGERFLVLRVL